MIGVLAICGVLAFALLFLIAAIATPYLHEIERSIYGPPGPHGPIPRGSPAKWFGPDAYPAAALRRGEEGRSVARVRIGTDGRPQSCRIVTSSGSDALDQATCRVAMEHAAFKPAKDQADRPIVSTWMLPVRWVLPK
ncbi:MAG: energy transducer TonB [Sphingomonas sp.]